VVALVKMEDSPYRLFSVGSDRAVPPVSWKDAARAKARTITIKLNSPGPIRLTGPPTEVVSDGFGYRLSLRAEDMLVASIWTPRIPLARARN
jgi:hypothetical protein